MSTPLEDVDLSQYKYGRHESSFIKLNEYRKDGILCDVIIKSQDGNEIPAHKCVLVSNSEYFDKMFIGPFKETTQDVVQINGISSNALKNLIDFMYTGELVTIGSDNIDEMIYGADLFQMGDVRNECIAYCNRSLCDENCLTIKVIAEIRAMTELSAKCLKHALERFNEIIRHQSFLDTDVEHIKQLLKDDNLNTEKEETVYRAVIEWIKHNEIERKHLLPELLTHVRLLFVAMDFLLHEFQSEPLITSSPECLQIFQKIIELLNYKDGDTLSETIIITNVRPRVNTIKRFSREEMSRLRFLKCSSTSTEIDYLNPDYLYILRDFGLYDLCRFQMTSIL
ncbi:hypothetical protein ACI65C_012315 [Semiaphis heraclei]